MKKTKRKALEAAGRRVGTAEEFLEQSGKCFFCNKLTPESLYCYGCSEYVCAQCEPLLISGWPPPHTRPEQHQVTISLGEYRKLKKPRKPR